MSALFGLVPAAYSWALVKPSPSGSAFPSPPLVGLRPFETSQPSGRPSPSLSALFILVPSFCSSELVSPSPSQSAPPSDGSSGSDPSPLTADNAERARNIAISTLIIFLSFMFFHFLYFWLLLHREPAVLSFQTPSPHGGRGVLGCSRCCALNAGNVQGDNKRLLTDNFYGCGICRLVGSHAFLSLVQFLVLFLQMHRISRVSSREPNVPSTYWNIPTLYEERDAVFRSSFERICRRE